MLHTSISIMRRLLAYLMLRRKLVIISGALLIGSLGILPLAIGGHEIVEAVDSPTFCTQVCHDVHYAEAITFPTSPHSEVPCADCHVGGGPKNLITSKLRGLKDIIPAITGNYERPISTPIENMRPSSETCETCHWSEKFTGDVVRVEASYDADESNTKRIDTRVLKVGGGKEEVSSGIHWHSTATVWYLPLDDKRQVIAWVGTENPDGSITEYVDPSRVDEITRDRITSEKRLMDCVDCHNRVSHVFSSPAKLIDAALTDGSIDTSLPFIKREAENALVPQNPSLKQAYSEIEKIKEFYGTSYPRILEEKEELIDSAISKLNEIAKLTTFADNLDWNTHLDNSGHEKPDSSMEIDWVSLSLRDESSGCFRCHGNLVEIKNAENVSMGLVKHEEASLDAKCSSCHYTLESPPNSPLAPATSHPTDGLDDCLACHSPSASRPFETDHPWSTNEACSSCHQSAPKLKPLPLAQPAEAKEVTHAVEGLEECLSCHGREASSPISEDHPWSTNNTCTACHQSAPELKPFPQTVPPPNISAISHSTDGLDDCFLCHGTSATSPISADHPWSTYDSCTVCHQTAPKLKPFPQATPPEDAEITHSTDGLEKCLSCHNPSGTIAFSSKHPWSTNDTCSACHEPASELLSFPQGSRAGSLPGGTGITHSTSGLTDCLSCHSTSPDHLWTNSGSCALCHETIPLTSMTSQPPSASFVTHSTSGLDDCLSCHSETGPSPYPTNHAGRTNGLCPICHQPAAAPTAPVAPTNLTTTAASAGQVNLGWTDNANNETGFRIERATNSTFSANLVVVNIAGAGTTSYSDTTASGSTTYYYRTYALNSAGDSAASNTASVTTPASLATAPAAPTNLTTTAASAGQVNLGWTDNANNETGFRIERATNSTFSANLVVVNIAGAGTTSYSDTTASGSTTYYYRVYAFNSAGDSAASNTASVTTPAPPPPITASQITHTTDGYTNCLACHSEAMFRPFPSDHSGRTNETCTTCHLASGSTSPPTLPLEKRIKHELDSQHQDCLSCHDRGESKPFPRSHIGYQNITCVACHRR